MGFTSQDDLINQITTNGKFGTVIYQKTITPAAVAGQWTDLTILNGIPVADTYAGSTLTWVATDESSAGAIPHGGNVSTATKHFLNAGASVFAAAGAPWILMCVDQVGYIPIAEAELELTSQRTVTMTALDSGCRYASGAGLRAYFSCKTAPLTGGPNLTEFTYLDSAGSSKTCPVTVGFHATPVAGAILHSIGAATRYMPFLPMASGSTSISDIVTFTLSGGTTYTGTGAAVLHLVKPLWTLPIPASGVYSMTDFVNQLPSLPKIPDGAYLKFLLFQTGATTNNMPIMVNFDYAYGG